MTTNIQYETIVGLEVHVQLSTNSKAYCSDLNKFGESPNTCISAISAGHPGTLPKANKEVINSAVKLGIALNCNITEYNLYARKNYFYPDLPKGYQITQDKTPICTGGYIEISDDKKINITRIHMEEDAGKSIHDLDPFYSLIDLNRAGVPLLEIVSEPEIRSSKEAHAYLFEVRKLVRYLGISNGNMEEGSLRCDANISVRPVGTKEFRNRVEVKNINSLKNVMKAIDLEVSRQIDCYNNKIEVNQETRNYNAATNTTSVLRTKEDAHDYRYFPEPDLPPVIVSQDFIEKIKTNMPSLPKERYKKYIKEYQLSDYDAKLLVEDKDISDFFEDTVKHTKHYKTVANLIMGTVKSYVNEQSIDFKELKVTSQQIAKLADMIADNQVSQIIVNQKLFPEMLKNGKSPELIAKEKGWIQKDDQKSIEDIINKVLTKYPEKVEAYKSGNKNLLGMFMGEIMRESKGQYNPKSINELLNKKLNQ
ncbi:MAG: Asp-tRNA(Asn)/Glu-tRNA(Gln) amidotransferase GatCAB subunit B [Flavobacteriales bacterium]|nr:Asp-tRNA(Asn)/Glu-tRNA(Gln) amidotransferase GatCAB subunit B [Flavobacteriales bacterium]|tara:strand:+ start:18806 stop:20242 length:1437 start_codon:yes stop_codon:yes gene_type:complete